MSKKLLYITTRLPWPQDNGRKVTLYNYCRGLHELCGYEVYLFSFLDEGQVYRPADRPNFIEGVETALPIGKLEILRNIARGLFNFSEPLQNGLYYSQANAERIRSYAAELGVSAVVVDMIRLAPYVSCLEGLDCFKSLDIDDLLSRRYRRQALNSGETNLLGAYSSKAGGAVNRLTSCSWLKKRILKLESKRMGRAEEKYARRFDNVFFVSPADAATFAKETGCKKVFAAGMGADVDYFSEQIQLDSSPNTVSFVGNLSAAANAASVEFIAKQLLPRIKHDVKLRVIGPVPDAIRNEYSENNAVEFLGKVEDLRPYVEATSLFLAPIAFGSGIKTKIVEAMAMGMCVVTNHTGAEGLTAKNGTEILIEDDIDSLACVVDDLLEDHTRREAIGAAARKYAVSRHRWDDLLSAFGENGF